MTVPLSPNAPAVQTSDPAAAPFAFLAKAQRQGVHGALVTIANAEGGSPRPVGTLMAVLADGRFQGHVSGGCVEPAIAAEVATVIAEGNDRILTFGTGSPYLDIRFPCGGRVDLLVHVHPDPKLLEDALANIAGRRPFSLTFLPQFNRSEGAADGRMTGWHGEQFVRRFVPRTRVLLIGRGPEFETTARVALATGLDLRLASPDSRHIPLAQALGAPFELLSHPGQNWEMPIDAWTATVLLLHDHDWETPLLTQALTAGGFYVGALGSPRTHRMRCESLTAMGVPQELVSRIHGPIGMIEKARDPGTLALSVLGEIARARMPLDQQ